MVKTMGRRCSICSDPARRRAVDAELIAGTTVAEVVRLFAPSMGFSEAAAYRHARHAHDPAQPLGVPAPDGENPADAARALVRVQAYLSGLLDLAEARGDDKLGVLVADKIRAVVSDTNALLGYDAASYSDELDGAQEFIRAVVKATNRDRSSVAPLVAGLESVGAFDSAEFLTSFYSK